MSNGIMNTRGRGWFKYRHLAIAVSALLALILYVWQMANAWAEQNHIIQYEAVRSSNMTQLMGKGVAAGAIGTLSFDNSSARALMRVQDMPTLPASQVYQMWCIDVAGHVDASTLFRVALDGQDSSTVMISAPHMVVVYPHFRVTIEPAGGSMMPSGPVVLEN